MAAYKASKKSQEQIAEEMSVALGHAVHVTTISRWVNGHMEPESVETLAAFSGACGKGDFRSLLERQDDEEMREVAEAALAPILDLLTALMNEVQNVKSKGGMVA